MKFYKNREIKFRAWDSKSKEMYYPYALIQEDNEAIKIAELLYGYEIYGASDDNDVLLQYIGLKDKNRVEVYEGDLVKYQDKIYEIRYDTASTSFYLYDKSIEVEDIKGYLISPLIISSSVVIGNIFEGIKND